MKKKISALLLSLALCAGLLAGCGTGETAEAPSDTDVQQVDSLKIAFSPYADADLISESTEPLEELLKAKLLEKGYDVGEIDMTVGTSYTAVGEALSAGSADLGFISGGNYVLFSDDCDVLLTALRYAINKDSENPADWNDGTIEENTEGMSTYYRCILLAGPSEKGQELLSKVPLTSSFSSSTTRILICHVSFVVHGDAVLQLCELRLADAAHLHDLFNGPEGAVGLPVRDDPPGQALSDAGQRIQLLRRGSVEIHRREVRGDLLPGDLRLCLDDYARDAILPIPKRQARQGAQEHRRQPQQNDLTFCRPSPSTHC